MPVVEPGHAPEGIVLGDLVEGFAIERVRPIPVHHAVGVGSVGLDQGARNVCGFAAHVDALHRCLAARVQMDDGLADEVARLRVRQIRGAVGESRVAVVERLDQRGRGIIQLEPLLRGPVQRIVFRAEQSILNGRSRSLVVCIPGQHGFACGIVDHPAVARVHAVLEEQVAGDVVAGSGVRRRVKG